MIKTTTENDKINYTTETSEMYARTSYLTTQAKEILKQHEEEIEKKENELNIIKNDYEKEVMTLKDKINSLNKISSMQREALGGDLNKMLFYL